MTHSILFFAEFVDLLSRLYELCSEAARSGCARPVTPRDVLSVAGWIGTLIRMTSLIQTATAAPHWLAGMVEVLPQVLLFLAAIVAVVFFSLVLVAFFPRRRRVSLGDLRLGPASFGPIRFFFASSRPRPVLPSAGPALLPSPSTSTNGSQPLTERRPMKYGARAERKKASRAHVAGLAPKSLHGAR